MDINRILLGKSPFTDVSSRELAEQIDSKRRCEKKLPLWFSTPKIYYPPKLSIEQTSSEVTANFKSHLVTGTTLLDVTGGFGVDSYYFAKAGMSVVYAEISPALSEIAQYNAGVLGVSNIRFSQGNGIDLLNSEKSFDTIFIDPSRRVAAQKVFQLQDCEPNVPGNIDRLLKASKRLIIKTSPLLDLQAGLKELRNVTSIYILSVKNDCKELLWILDAEANASEPEIVCLLLNETQQEYKFKVSEEREFTLNEFSEPKGYLYEPDVALLKAGCFKLLCRDFNISKLHFNSHLYTSETVLSSFPGRSFVITQWGEYKRFMKTNKIHKANIIARNFPLSPVEIKKKHRLTDGGEDFLIFTTGAAGQLITILCRKV